MDTAGTRVHDPRQPIFKDGLGARYRHDSAEGPCEILVLRDGFAPIPSFEFLVRERVNRLAHVRSGHFARVYDVEHAGDAPKIVLVSQSIAGVRLSRMLSIAEQNLLPLDVESALCLTHQILIAMAELHEDAPDACHGSLATERVVVTSTGGIVVVEHVLGAALAQLRHSPERYWKELRITLPIAVTAPTLDRRADVAAIGMIALALLLGRPLADEEYPGDVSSLVNGSFGLGGGFERFPEWLRDWLSQALSLEPTRWFASAVEACHAFEVGLKAGNQTASPEKLQAFLREYERFDHIEPALPVTPAPAHAPASVSAPANVPAPPAPSHVTTPVPVQVTAPPTPVHVTAPQPVPVSAPAAASAAVSSKRPSVAVTPAPVVSMPPPLPHSRDEEDDMPQMPVPPRSIGGLTFDGRTRFIAAAAVVLALTSGGVMAARRYLASPATVTPATGTVVVNTDPSGAAVVVDGQAHGTTPMTATLNVGQHTIEISQDSVRRTLTVNVTANAQISQFVEMPKAAAGTGDLQVRTDPSGAKVSVDGQLRGMSPLTVPGLAPGSHTVVLENDLGSVHEDVTVQAGATASLVVPMKAPQGAPVSGWISITAPAELQIFENQRLLGSSRTDRIMVAAGRHDIEFANDALGYHSSQSIQVAPGQVAKVKPDWPQGTIAINATPWANVSLDGQEVGETPVGNTTVPIGTHEVVFRHPQFGEQRITATVTASTPTRLSVDMRKK